MIGFTTLWASPEFQERRRDHPVGRAAGELARPGADAIGIRLAGEDIAVQPLDEILIGDEPVDVGRGRVSVASGRAA